MSFRYLFLDSTHRDRLQYPNPAHFAVGVETIKERSNYFKNKSGVSNTQTVNERRINGDNAIVARESDKITHVRDLVLNNVVPLGSGAFGTVVETLQGAVSRNEIQLDGVLASDIDGFYDNLNIIMTAGPASGQYATITSYENNGGLHDADLSPGFSVNPGLNTYVIPNIVRLDPTASAIDDDPNYVGSYIRIDGGLGLGQYVLITKYDGVLKLAVIAHAWRAPIVNVPANGDLYTVHIPKENYQWLEFAKTQVTQPMCYTCKLLNLTLPADGALTNGRYLAVEIRAINSRNTHTIISNNHDIGNAQFIVPLDDNNSNINFLQLNNSKMTQTLKFKPDDELQLAIYWPDGTQLVIGPDNLSPLDPDPSVQVNVLFELKPMPMHNTMSK